jgi:3D (Asp-Asp-Asp) domain-containing protein
MTALLALLIALHSAGFHAEVRSMSVSAYWNGSGAPPYQGLTASGQYTREGVCACGPSFPYGTILLVSGKWCVCLDRGGAITDVHIDLWMPTEAEALEWGRKQADVVIVRGRE